MPETLHVESDTARVKGVPAHRVPGSGDGNASTFGGSALNEVDDLTFSSGGIFGYRDDFGRDVGDHAAGVSNSHRGHGIWLGSVV